MAVEGIELIVAALTAGASAGATNTATAAIQDTYASLKGLIGRRLDGREEVRQALEAGDVKSIGGELVDAGAHEDPVILAAAHRLLTLTATDPRIDISSSQGIYIGDGGAQTNHFHAP